MPVNYALYPPSWPEISKRIRERAGNRCEQCGVPNGATITRSSVNPERYLLYTPGEDVTFRYADGTACRLSELPEEFYDTKYIKVVLTVAHLDHTPANCDESNLRAWCQRCHLTYDAKHHAQNAKRTRAAKKQAALRGLGQLELWSER